MNSTQLLILLSVAITIFSCSSESSASNTKLLTSDHIEVAVLVKKSLSGICHDGSSGSFKRTKNFTPYVNMDLCIASGGRAYRRFKSPIDIAEQEAIDGNIGFVALYNRSDWNHWIDADSDCQNTRHELLISTSSIAVKFKSDDQCNVLSGSWYDQYGGENYTISNDLDLDHVVPLKFAHGHGGDIWSRDKKQQFANDLDNLLLVSASLNRQKGAKGLDEWLPPNQSYRCDYITHFDTVMARYELKYIASEKRVIDRMVKACNK